MIIFLKNSVFYEFQVGSFYVKVARWEYWKIRGADKLIFGIDKA